MKELSKFGSFAGFIIGENNSAYYSFGSNDEGLFFLDPHILSTGEISEHPVKVYFINYKNLHPSICACFLLRNKEDIGEFSKNLESIFNEHILVKLNEASMEEDSGMVIPRMEKLRVFDQESFFPFSIHYFNSNR